MNQAIHSSRDTTELAQPEHSQCGMPHHRLCEYGSAFISASTTEGWRKSGRVLGAAEEFKVEGWASTGEQIAVMRLDCRLLCKRRINLT